MVGYLIYYGSVDDVFKVSNYKISLFELESILIAGPAVAETAGLIRLSRPKADVFLARMCAPTPGPG